MNTNIFSSIRKFNSFSGKVPISLHLVEYKRILPITMQVRIVSALRKPTKNKKAMRNKENGCGCFV